MNRSSYISSKDITDKAEIKNNLVIDKKLNVIKSNIIDVTYIISYSFPSFCVIKADRSVKIRKRNSANVDFLIGGF